MSFSKWSKKNVRWDYETKGFEFVKASEVEEGVVYPIHGVFITPDKGFGEGAVVILDDKLLNAPSASVETIRDIINDDESVELIKAGKAGVRVYTYTSKKYKRTGYGLEFVDIE